jgi:hypothetical protein
MGKKIILTLFLVVSGPLLTYNYSKQYTEYSDSASRAPSLRELVFDSLSEQEKLEFLQEKKQKTREAVIFMCLGVALFIGGAVVFDRMARQKTSYLFNSGMAFVAIGLLYLVFYMSYFVLNRSDREIQKFGMYFQPAGFTVISIIAILGIVFLWVELSDKRTTRKKKTNIPPDFEEQISRKSDQELTDILSRKHDYIPEAIKVVEQELNKRGIDPQQQL